MKKIIILIIFFIVQAAMSDEYKILLKYNELVAIPENIIKDNLKIKGFCYLKDFKIKDKYLVTENIDVAYYTNRIKGCYFLQRGISFEIYFIIYIKNDKNEYEPYTTSHPENLKKEFSWESEYIDEIRLADYKAFSIDISIDSLNENVTTIKNITYYPEWTPFFKFGNEINIDFSKNDIINDLAKKVKLNNKYNAFSRNQIKTIYFDENGFLKLEYKEKIDDIPDLIYALIKKGYFVTTDCYSGNLVIE